jgi:hypothetical protein
MEITTKDKYKGNAKADGVHITTITAKNIQGFLLRIKYMVMAGTTFCLELSIKEIGAVE